MRVTLTSRGREDYTAWSPEPRALRRVNRLIEESARNPGDGIGKPERLKGDLVGYWSRRIDLEHRLVYIVDGDLITVIQARYHY